MLPYHFDKLLKIVTKLAMFLHDCLVVVVVVVVASKIKSAINYNLDGI